MPSSQTCEHHECRCARARELMTMADAAADLQESGRLAAEAVEVHSRQVKCRRPEGGDRGEQT